MTCDVSISATDQSGVTAHSQASTPSFGYVATFLRIEGIYGIALSSSGLEVVVAASDSGSGAVDAIHLETGQSRRLADVLIVFGNNAFFALVGENVVVANHGPYVIGLLDVSTGLTTTIAGSGFKGISDGVGTNARFCGPTGLAVIPGGEHVLALDYNSIRKVALASGEVTRLGTFVPTSCEIANPVGYFPQGHIALSPDGQSVAVASNIYVYWFSMETGEFTRLVYSNLHLSHLVFLRGGSHLLFSDMTNKILWMLELETMSSCIVAGNMGAAGDLDGARESALLSSPGDLIMMPDGERVLVVDSNTLRLVNVDMAGSGGLCDICPCGDTCAPATIVYSCEYKNGKWDEPFSWKHGTYLGFLTFGSYVVVVGCLATTPVCCCCLLGRRRRRVVRRHAPS